MCSAHNDIQCIVIHMYIICWYHLVSAQVPLKAIQGKLYVRISAHVYNELMEYQHLADAITQMIK